jgi:hypothetical protein
MIMASTCKLKVKEIVKECGNEFPPLKEIKIEPEKSVPRKKKQRTGKKIIKIKRSNWNKAKITCIKQREKQPCISTNLSSINPLLSCEWRKKTEDEKREEKERKEKERKDMEKITGDIDKKIQETVNNPRGGTLVNWPECINMSLEPIAVTQVR